MGPLLTPLCMFFLPRKLILCLSNSARGCLQADVNIEYVTAPVSLTGLVFMYTFNHLIEE